MPTCYMKGTADLADNGSSSANEGCEVSGCYIPLCFFSGENLM